MSGRARCVSGGWRQAAVVGSAVVLAVVLLSGCGPDGPVEEQDPAVAALLARGWQAYEAGDYSRVIALTDSATRIQPLLAEPYFLRGIALRNIREYDDAYIALKQATIADPDYPGAWHNFGTVAYEMDRYQEAARYYQKEVEREPSPGAWMGMAGAYLELGKTDSAAYACRQALDLDPTHLDAHLGLADLHRMAGAYDEALDHARQAVRLDSTHIHARYVLGALLVRAGAHEEAVAQLQRVVAERPWFHSAFYSMGQALQGMGRMEEAEQVLERSNQLRAIDAEIQNYQDHINVNPGDPRPRVDLATALRRAGRFAESMDAYRAALTLIPGNLAIQNNIASLHLTMGDTLEAMQGYIEVLRQDSTYVETWLNLAVLYRRVGRTEDSRMALRRAIRSNPDHPALRRYLEHIQRRQGPERGASNAPPDSTL